MSFNDSILSDTVQNAIEQSTFGWIDYIFFGIMLSVSAAIGVYFGFYKKQVTTTDYLLAGKTMGCFPVAMSITASHVSGITLLGVPSESYQYGTQYAACIVTITFVGLATSFIFLPVFHKLQLTSSFEYLEVRFARSIRQFASMLFTISLILHTPIVVYVPALAFSQVTGFELYYITPAIGILCIFYTTVGGLKAVVWSDTIQFTVTVITLFIVLTLGIISVGGLGEIWRIAEEGGRIKFFNMDPNPFLRMSFLGMAIGLTPNWLAVMGISQGSMQRFLAVPTVSQAKISILIMGIGLIIVKCLSVYTGLIMFAKYHDCDPIRANIVKKSDQLLPYYVMDVAGNIPGLPGLFVAALVSAALSTMSGGLNTVAGTIWEDFISPWVPESETKQRTATRVMKLTVILVGILCVGLVFVAAHMGSIFTISTSMHGVASGTLAGIFTLGVLIPWATHRGTMIGGIIGFLTSLWMVMGTQYHKLSGHIRDIPLSTSIENCTDALKSKAMDEPTLPPIDPADEPMAVFKISMLYYSFIGWATVIICGTIASFLTGTPNLNALNRDHFAPIVRRFLPKEKYTEVPMSPVLTMPKSQDEEKEIL